MSAIAGQVFPAWVMERIEVPTTAQVVDVGAGWGRFALPLLELHDPALVVCTDVWTGMVESCKETLAEPGGAASARVAFGVADIMRLPFCEEAFDVAMANHMLYELDDVPRALSEISRVLRDNGRLVATTYSDNASVPLLDCHAAALRSLGESVDKKAESPFSLENGESLLRKWFTTVQVDVMEDRSSTDDIETFVELYSRTGRYRDFIADESKPEAARRALIAEFEAAARRLLADHGSIDTVTIWALFQGSAPVRDG